MSDGSRVAGVTVAVERFTHFPPIPNSTASYASSLASIGGQEWLGVAVGVGGETDGDSRSATVTVHARPNFQDNR